MILIKNLTKKFGHVETLKGIDLDISKGELFAYLGPNGAGKTTTIRILTGITKPSSGFVLLDGINIFKDPIKAKRKFGLVMQSINLDLELSVYENLDIHGRLFNLSYKERKLRIGEVLSYVEMVDRKDSLIKNLSGGLRRRVTIARAMLHRPKILFLDEPTVGLDPSIRRGIWELIKKRQKEGTTIFLTTHYIEEAEFLANRVAFLNQGKIVTVDTPQNLISKVGGWAIDIIDNGKMTSIYFKTREQAQKYAVERYETFTLRRVNLEDAFLSLTGERV
ncbi:ATP-binding cassette domain-containing protein [Desulfothermus okinawensis JCM 13304]